MIPLFVLELAGLVGFEDDAARRARLHEAVNRLGLRVERAADLRSILMRWWRTKAPVMDVRGDRNLAWMIAELLAVPWSRWGVVDDDRVEWPEEGYIHPFQAQAPILLDWLVASQLPITGIYEGGPRGANSWEDFHTVMDWMEGVGADLTSLSFDEALRRARQWHETLPEAVPQAEAPAGSHQVVARWDDGWTLLELMDGAALVAEGQALGHCVGGAGYVRRLEEGLHRYFSLRGRDGSQKVTIEMASACAMGKPWVLQVRGRRNLVPLVTWQEETLRALRAIAPSDTSVWAPEVSALFPEAEIVHAWTGAGYGTTVERAWRLAWTIRMMEGAETPRLLAPELADYSWGDCAMPEPPWALLALGLDPLRGTHQWAHLLVDFGPDGRLRIAVWTHYDAEEGAEPPMIDEETYATALRTPPTLAYAKAFVQELLRLVRLPEAGKNVTPDEVRLVRPYAESPETWLSEIAESLVQWHDAHVGPFEEAWRKAYAVAREPKW